MKTNNRLSPFGVALAVALLALAPAAAVVAQEDPAAAAPAEEEEVTLTGQLSTDDVGGYVLVEQESGESIPLVSSLDLSAHVDTTVNVTGTWAEDEEGNKTFEVSSVEPAE